MQATSAPDLIRACFHAYETKDREAIEALLADDFTFSSPLDDKISRDAYFQRCWPNSAHHRAFHIERCFGEGNEAFVTYTCERTDGALFRNTEFFLTDGQRIRHVDVYFGPDTSVTVAEAAVRAVIEDTVRATRAKDAAALMKHYHTGVLAFDLLIPLQYTGASTLQKRAADWLSSFHGPLDYELRDLRIAAGDTTAFAHSLNHVQGTPQDGGHIDMWWRATLGLQKYDDTWLITHAHSSEPFDMETGRASLDLRP